MYNTSIVIFSKNRPLQLQACIESLLIHLSGDDKTEINVLYKASSDRFEEAYEKVMKNYPIVNYVLEKNFRLDLLDMIRDKEYVMFVVDDCIFTSSFNIKEIENILYFNEPVLGFSFRLGTNINYCYPLNVYQTLRNYNISINDKFISFKWAEQEAGDFSYPLEVSSSLYRVVDLLWMMISAIDFKNPNELEAYLNGYSYNFRNNYLMSYKTSVAFCNPINIVQSVAPNRYSGKIELGADALLSLFESGKRIDVFKYHEIDINSPHQEMELYLKDE